MAITQPIPTTMLERLLSVMVRSFDLSAARITVQNQVKAVWGSPGSQTPLAELGLVEGEYQESGLLELYGRPRSFSSGDLALLEDFAVLVSETLGQEQTGGTQQALEQSSSALLSLNTLGQIERCNPAAEQLWGYTASQLCGQSVLMLVDCAEDSLEQHPLEALLRQGQRVLDLEVPTLHRLGTRLQTRLNLTPVCDMAGQLLRVLLTAEDTAERRRLERDLERQRDFYESVLDNIPAEVGVLDPERRYLYINPRGLHDPELRRWAVGRQDHELAPHYPMPPEFWLERERRLELTLERRALTVWDEEFLTPRGPRQRLTYANPVYDGAGELRFVLGYGVDITDLKEAQAAQFAALEQYRQLFEGAGVGLYRVSAQSGQLVAVNPAWVNMAGYASAEHCLTAFNQGGQSVFVDPQHRRRVAEALIAGQEVREWRTPIARADTGEVRWVSESVRGVRSEGGGPLYFEGTLRDISDEVQALERLRLIERAVHSSSDAITLYSADLELIYQNPAALETFGPTQAAAMHSTDGTGALEVVLGHVREHGAWSGELELPQRDGTPLPCLVQIDTIRAEEGAPGTAQGTVLGALSVVRDISLRKQVEQVKDQFITTVSHELRTPLTSLRGALGLLAAGGGGDALEDEARGLISIALSNTERLARRISDILDMGRLERGELHLLRRRVNLRALLERAMLEHSAEARQGGVQLQLYPGPEVVIPGDEERLFQVLLHLLSNAIKFSGPQQRVEVTLERSAHAAQLSVQDRGPGIARTFEDQLFGRFMQADRSSTRETSGLGLGLAVSRAIVEQHGGAIGFAPRHGGGSTFWIELPLSESDA